MLLRSIAIVIVVGITCVLFPRGDADARGGGGFHGGGMSGFHGARFGSQHDHPMMRGDVRRNMHEKLMRLGGRVYRSAHSGGNHFARANFGHWHRSPGFGNSAHHSPIADGQWHAGREFR